MTGLEGRVAIVTGASRGIGYAIAARLVAEGVSVCITARKEHDLRIAAEALGENVIWAAGHADDPAHQADTVAGVLETFGRLDILVNNTGINPVAGPLLNTAVGVGEKIVGVNCLGALLWVQRSVEAWMGENGGSVVNVSSVAGLRPAPGIGMYGGSKAMLNHLTMGLAMELAPAVRVNAVAPAVVRTRFGAPLFEGREQEVAADYPLGRLGEPQDVAAAVAFLASKDAAWITGHVLVVDGGLMLRGGV